MPRAPQLDGVTVELPVDSHAGPAAAVAEAAPPATDTPLVWPPPDEDVEQVHVLEMDWTRADAAASAAVHVPDSGADATDGAATAGAPAATAALAAHQAAPDVPEARDEPPRGERQSLASVVQAPSTRFSPDRSAGEKRAARWWLVPTVALAIGVGLAIGYYVRPMVAPAPTTASLTVETAAADAEVSIDGTPRGRAPVRVTLPAGEHRLAVSSAGVTREASVLLNPGADVVRVFDFPQPETTTTAGTAGAYGSLNVQTRPAGAQVVIAGQARGRTPLTVTDLPAGPVDVDLFLSERKVTQQVNIQPGKEALLIVPLTGAATEPGWVAVRSLVPLRILEGGRVVGTTDSERIMLSGGRHTLELVNESLEVKLSRQVVIQGGGEVPIDVEAPQGLVNINARPWAEVFVEGNRLGETPLGNVSLPVGNHELVFRHPQLGERRQTVTVKAATHARVSVTFTP